MSEGKSSLTLRIISAVVLAPPVLAAIYVGSPFFDILIAVCALILAWEWNRMHTLASGNHDAYGRALWLGIGAVYIIAASAALILLREYEHGGRDIVFWLLIVVWASDTGAYVAGSLVGGPRLAPSISPKKTWSGLAGGIACAGAAGSVMIILTGMMDSVRLAAFGGALLGAVAQGGDMFESWIKRRCGVKDASNIIPGHGGLFDRVDGLLAAALAMVLIGFLSKGGIYQ